MSNDLDRELEKLEKVSFLIIDDDEDIVDVMNDVISSNIHSNSILAYNGLDGYHEAQLREFDFIVTDFQLPSLNGIEFIRQVRTRKGPNQDTPIILLSGYQPELDPKDHFWENVFFLEKPLTSSKLLFNIKCCMRLKKMKGETLEKVGGPGET